ncbi:hypothetical protein D9V41_00455 [Aeromicrobium phragmitis]|uniref:DUF6194 domain-containing protein n=1 Tax=Aeromicrobium phragmitis TaxID=2478914 RepID=A0A3L8PP67_9ACTN|nr:DUF6194 family protein [Aeromicrobium phragmitis]RLV57167.1 hypothetical protein D9V41_00455 [Aeromicrobium phragmitis]
MTIEQIRAVARALDGVLELAPRPGDAFPELAWGDYFFYFAPDGALPQREQPFATIVTKDYPDDTASRLDGEGRWRLNIHVGRARFAELLGEKPSAEPTRTDFGTVDVLLPHPVYRAQGWVAVVNPGPRTSELAVSLLREAHTAAQRRTQRRLGGSAGFA